VWLLATPAVFIGVFWFALEIGLRTSTPVHGIPYIVWLAVGMVPWFYMSDMISGGSNVYRRYSYLVNRLRFPIAVISSFYGAAHFIVFLLSTVIIAATMVLTRTPVTVYAVQLPVLAIIMYFFWVVWSLLTSPLSALSKDFHNLVKALSLPLFWLSGTIFDMSQVQIEWVQWVMAFNPVTFFVTSYRAALCDHFWLWERPRLLFCFLGMFVVMLLLALRVQKRLGTEVADVL
jgi:teichoic acid transport system permease protein